MSVMRKLVEEEGEDQRSAVDDSVKQYLKEIGMYPLLTAEQELLAGRAGSREEISGHGNALLKPICAWSSVLPSATQIKDFLCSISFRREILG